MMYKFIAISSLLLLLGLAVFFKVSTTPNAGSNAVLEAPVSDAPNTSQSSQEILGQGSEPLPRPNRVANHSEDQTDSGHYRFTKEVALADVPTELHAKSAIQILATENISSILQSKAKEFTIPLSSSQIATLSINKVIERSPQDVSLMGSVAGSDRSYFHFQFIDGALQSGSIKFYGNGDFYQVRTTEEDNLIVAFRDSSVELLNCGCDDGAH